MNLFFFSTNVVGDGVERDLKVVVCFTDHLIRKHVTDQVDLEYDYGSS